MPAESCRSAVGCVIALISLAGMLAAEIRPADLVGADAGLVIEVSKPMRAWEEFQRGELYRRWRQTSLARDVIGSEPLNRWNEIDGHVTKATGVSLADQLTDLCARELVLALYLPPSAEPQGVLISRASSAAAIERFIASGAKLEPDATTQAHEHLGEKYYSRLSAGNKQTRLYYTTFNDIFALSDREARIRQIVELKQSTERPSNSSLRMTDLEAYRIAATGADEPPAMLRAVLIAAPWQRVWQESAEKDAISAWLATTWPAIHSLSVHIRTQNGLHIEGQLHLDPIKAGDRWQAWTASTTNPQELLAAMPPEAVLAAAGGIHFQPLWDTVIDVVSKSDREGFKRGRRMLRGFLGGKDLFTDILPALTHDVGLYAVPARSEQGLPFDGILQFRFPPQTDAKELFLALDQALSSGLTLISAQANDAHDDDAVPTTVHSDVTENKIIRWLESPLPIEVAYQLTHAGLMISRSPETLRSNERSQPSKSTQSSPPVFLAAREKWFPDAGQVLIVDLVKLHRHLTSSAGEASAGAMSVPQSELLSLGDLAYVALQMDVKRLTIRVGVSAE